MCTIQRWQVRDITADAMGALVEPGGRHTHAAHARGIRRFIKKIKKRNGHGACARGPHSVCVCVCVCVLWVGMEEAKGWAYGHVACTWYTQNHMQTIKKRGMGIAHCGMHVVRTVCVCVPFIKTSTRGDKRSFCMSLTKGQT